MAQAWTPPDYAVKEEWTPPNYISAQEDEESKPKEVPKKSAFSKAWDLANAHPDIIAPTLTSKVTEPLMKYGESGTNLSHKAALYGGQWLDTMGKTADEMLSPLNAVLTATTMGSGAAAKSGLIKLAKALEAPGRAAAVGMMGHGGYKTLTGDSIPERLAGIGEAVLGSFGRKSNVREGVSANTKPNYILGQGDEIPASRPYVLGEEQPPSIKPKTEPIAKVSAESTVRPKITKPANEFDGVNEYLAKIRSGEIPESTRLSDYLESNKPIEASISLTDKELLAGKTTPDKPYSATYRHFDENLGEHQYDIQGGPERGYGKSTVGEKRLNELGIDVPETPIWEPPVYAKPIQDEAGNIIAPPQQAIPEKIPVDVRQDPIAPEAPPRPVIADRRKQVPITAANEVIRTPTEAIDRLKAAIESSANLRPQQEALNAAERSRRAGMIASVETPGLAGHYQRLGMLKGEFPKIPIESQLNQGHVDSLMDAIKNSHLRDYEQVSAGSGLVKAASGRIVPPYEAKLLGQVFGNDIEQLIHLHGGLGAAPIANIINNTVNLPKTLMSTMDLSAPLRQGLPLIGKKEYWNSFNDMFKHFGSEKSFLGLQESLAERPHFDIGHDSGLYLADVGENLFAREEQFLSQAAEKIPLIGKFVRASERAYVGFLNKLRADTFDNLLEQAIKMGHNAEEIAPQIAKFVNNSTGRGSLGRFEKNAVELNAGLFSPRLISSRLTMLNPKYYVDLDPFVRKEALKALFSVAAASSTVAGLAKMGGAQVSLDSNSSDFMKPRFGNTRLDPFGGFQQYVVAASRLISGKETTTSGREYDLNKGKFPGPTRLSVLTNLARSKESPIASFIDNMLSGNQAFAPGGLGGVIGANKPSAEIINRFTPMIMSDLIELYKEDPSLLPLGIPATFGMGVQTFENKSSASPFRMSIGKP